MQYNKLLCKQLPVLLLNFSLSPSVVNIPSGAISDLLAISLLITYTCQFKGEKDISTEDAGKTLTYYTWLQADDDIIATFPLPPATNKADISLAFAPKSLRVRVKGETRLEGDLHADISPDDCTWTLCNENRLVFFQFFQNMTVHLVCAITGSSYRSKPVF